MADNFTLDENAIVEIREYDLLVIKQKLSEIERVEDKISFIETKLKELKGKLDSIAKDIESLDGKIDLNSVEFNKKISIINYKQMIFRNSKFGLLEELVFWKDRFIVRILSEKAKILTDLKALRQEKNIV
jgi:hypothetical protein